MGKRNIKLSILFLILLLGSFPLTAQTKQVRVGAFDSFPLIFKDADGSIRGLYIDLLDEIGKKENIAFKYVFGTWNDGLERIQSGEVDMLTSVGYTDARAIFMDYCENPILTVWGELYTPSASEINTLFDIQGKTVGVLKNDIFDTNFREMAKKFDISCAYVEFESYEEVLAAAASNTVDAGIVDVTFGAARQKKYKLKSSGIIFYPLDIFFTTADGKNRELRSLLDGYLSTWKHEELSVYSQAKQKWLYGSVGTVAVVPPWVRNSVVLVVVLFLAAFGFILLLRIQVQKATDRIRKKEKQIGSISDNIKNGMIYQVMLDAQGDTRKFTYLSNAVQALYGITPEQGIADANLIYDCIHQDDAQKLADAERQSLRTFTHMDCEFRIREPSGNYRWSQIVSTPKRLENGIVCYDGIEFVITERKQAEEKIRTLLAEKELLLKEVHHRIKNNMNTIKALLSMQLSAEENPSTAASLKDAENRVQSIIMLYDRLYCSDNYRELSVQDYVKPLTQEIVSGFPSRNKVQLQTEIEEFILNIQTLSPLGIIINELLTNIMKHAFTDRETGLISISLSLKDTTVQLVIADDGMGIPESVNLENSTGFGLQLIQMLTEQLGGTVSLDRSQGTRFTIQFKAL